MESAIPDYADCVSPFSFEDSDDTSSLSSALSYDTESSLQGSFAQHHSTRRGRYARNRRRAELDSILNQMKRHHITPRRFVRLFYQYKRGIKSDRYLTPQLRREHLYPVLKQLILKDPSIISNIVKPELDALVEKIEQFGRYDEDTDPETIDFSKLINEMGEHAPFWNRLIRDLMTNQFANEDLNHQARFTDRLFMITAIITYTRAKKQSNYFQKAVGFYLHGLGIKRRALGFLHGLGICNSPTDIIRMNKRIADSEEVQ